MVSCDKIGLHKNKLTVESTLVLNHKNNPSSNIFEEGPFLKKYKS